MNKEIRITKVALRPGAAIYKSTTHSGRKCFVIDVIYTLADGREIPSSITRERKKDVLTAFESENNSAIAGAKGANFDDEGRFWGTVTRYWTIQRKWRPIQLRPPAAA